MKTLSSICMVLDVRLKFPRFQRWSHQLSICDNDESGQIDMFSTDEMIDWDILSYRTCKHLFHVYIRLIRFVPFPFISPFYIIILYYIVWRQTHTHCMIILVRFLTMKLWIDCLFNKIHACLTDKRGEKLSKERKKNVNIAGWLWIKWLTYSRALSPACFVFIFTHITRWSVMIIDRISFSFTQSTSIS